LFEDSTFRWGSESIYSLADDLPVDFRADIVEKEHSFGSLEREAFLDLIGSAILLKIRYSDSQRQSSIHRQPRLRIEYEIIAIPLEVFGASIILFSCEVYLDALLVYSFSDVFDIKDEISV